MIASTEYRNQFAWPKDEAAPRKSISMGALKKAAVAEGKCPNALKNLPQDYELCLMVVNPVMKTALRL